MEIDTKTLLERGVVDVIVKKELAAKLNAGKKLKVKFGIDPTGADLHLGHMVPIKKLKEFQDAGHTIQLVYGNFTGQIGDPTDKTGVRQPKSQEELEANSKKYLEQIGKVLDIDNVEVLWNADWLGKLNFADIVQLASTFTVHQMLERDMYQERIKKEKPIHLHEFMYPLMQGYDSYALNSELEIGGTDQTFNMLAGRTIQKAYGQEPQHVLSVPILIGTDGTEKMGKSLGNYIGVGESPKEMFGKTMSIPDKLIVDYFELATDITMQELDEIEAELSKGENPRNLKVRLAKEIVTMYHSAKDAEEAEKEFIEIFANKGLPTDIETKNLGQAEINIIDLIAEVGYQASKSDIRRVIQGGGVKIEGEKITDLETIIKLDGEKLLQVGKRFFIKISQ